MATMDIDSSHVRAALEEVEDSLNYIQKALSNVQDANSSLNSGLRGKVRGFDGAINSLLKALSTTKKIITSCDTYAEGAEKTVDSIKELSEEFLLGLGKGPINEDLIESPEEIKKKLEKEREKRKQEKAKQELKASLIAWGYSEIDAEALVKSAEEGKDLSSEIEKLDKEIYEEYCNGNVDRFKAQTESKILQGMHYNQEESERRKSEIERTIKRLEKEKDSVKEEAELYSKAVKRAHYDSKKGVYVYLDEKGNFHEFTKESFESLKEMQSKADSTLDAYNVATDNEIKNLKTELGTIETNLSDPNKRDFSYNSVGEIDIRIKEIEESLKKEFDGVLAQEKEDLLNLRRSIDYIVENGKYILKDDFEEGKNFDASKAKDATYHKNSWSLFGEDYSFMDSDEYRGALLARMLNGDAIVIPDIQGSSLNVCGADGQEFYFDGNERKLEFNEYQTWINRSLNKEENAPVVISPQEIEIFNYICKSEGYGKGYEYLQSKEKEFDQRYITIKKAEDEEFARSNTWSGALSIFTAVPEAFINTGKVITRKNAGEDIHYSDIYSSSNVWNSTISGDLHKQSAVLGYAYDTLYSADKLMLSAVTAYGTGGGQLATTATNAALYGVPTFTSTLNAAKGKNLDDLSAIRYALFCAGSRTLATSRMVTSAMGIEGAYNSMLNSGQVTNTINNMVNSSSILSKNPELSSNVLLAGYCMGSQGMVSATTAVADKALTQTADILMNGDKSDLNIKFKNYKELHENATDLDAYLYLAGDSLSDSFSTFVSAFGPGALLGTMKADAYISHQKNMDQTVNFKEAFATEPKTPQEDFISSGNGPSGGPSGYSSSSPTSGNSSSSTTSSDVKTTSSSSGPGGWIVVKPKGSEDFDVDDMPDSPVARTAFSQFVKQMDVNGNEVSMIDTKESSDTTVGHYAEQVEMAIDSSGNAVPSYVRVWVPESGDTSVGSIQQTSANITDSYGVKVPVQATIDGKVVDTFTVINEKGGDSILLPFAPNFSNESKGNVSSVDWAKATGAFTPKQIDALSKLDSISKGVANNGNKITLEDLEVVYEQTKLPLDLKDRLIKQFEKDGLIAKTSSSKENPTTDSVISPETEKVQVPQSNNLKDSQPIIEPSHDEIVTVKDKKALDNAQGRYGILSEQFGKQMVDDAIEQVKEETGKKDLSDIETYLEYEQEVKHKVWDKHSEYVSTPIKEIESNDADGLVKRYHTTPEVAQTIIDLKIKDPFNSATLANTILKHDLKDNPDALELSRIIYSNTLNNNPDAVPLAETILKYGLKENPDAKKISKFIVDNNLNDNPSALKIYETATTGNLKDNPNAVSIANMIYNFGISPELATEVSQYDSNHYRLKQEDERYVFNKLRQLYQVKMKTGQEINIQEEAGRIMRTVGIDIDKAKYLLISCMGNDWGRNSSYYWDYNHFKEDFADSEKKYTNEELAAILGYVKTPSINKYARGFQISDGKTYYNDGTFSPELSQEELATITNDYYLKLYNALNKYSLPRDVIVFRGASLNSLNKYGVSVSDSEEEIKKKLDGKYEDGGFMSTSAVIEKEGNYLGNDVNFIIDLKAGTPCGELSSTTFYEKECEVLIPPNVNFKVNDVKKIDGKIVVYLTSIPTKSIEKNNNDFEVINVSNIDTNSAKTTIFSHGVNPNIMNMSYKGYDYVYKTDGDVNKVINGIINNSPSGKVLLEINSTVGLTRESLNKLPSNVRVRVLGDYGPEYFKGIKSNDMALHTLENVTYSLDDMKKIIDEIEKFESGIDSKWSDAKKAEYTYNYIFKNIKYRGNGQDESLGNTTRSNNYDGLTSLIVKASTSEGLAHTYKELLTRQSIICYEVSGRLDQVGQHAFNVVTFDTGNVIVDISRNKLNDYYEELQANPNITDKEHKELDKKIDKNYKSYQGTGFGVENVGQYTFISNKDLAPTVMTMQKISLKRTGKIISEIYKNNNEAYRKGIIRNHLNLFDGIQTSNTPRAKYLENWAKSEAVSRICQFFGDVDPSEINTDSIIFLESDEFDMLGLDSGLQGFDNGKVTILRIPNSTVYTSIYESIIHELLHKLSSDEFCHFKEAKTKLIHDISGFDDTVSITEIDDKGNRNLVLKARPYEGFNEAVTEFFAGLILPEISNNENCAYYDALQGLKKIIYDMNISGINLESLKHMYRHHDVSPIKKLIDKVTTEGFFEDVLMPGFNASIHTGIYKVNGKFVNGDVVFNNAMESLEKYIDNMRNDDFNKPVDQALLDKIYARVDAGILNSDEKDLAKQYFSLAPSVGVLNTLSEIILKASYNGHGFYSGLCNENDTFFDSRVFSMANLYLTHPETFEFLANNDINLFHGTNSINLDSIINEGIMSAKKQIDMGKSVMTGEESILHSRQSDYISFTDVLNIAQSYVHLNDNESFGVIIGTTSADILSVLHRNISSDLPEIGVRSEFPSEKIKTILVPESKVDIVKKMVGDKDIMVLPINDSYESLFYFNDGINPFNKGYDTVKEIVDNTNYDISVKTNDVDSFKRIMGDAIKDVKSNDDGTFTIKTKYGEEISVTRKGIYSQNLEQEILDLNERHEALLVDDWLLNHVDNIDSLVNEDPDRQQQINRYISKVAKTFGTDVETFKKVYAETFKRIINDSEIGMRVSNESLSKILDSGEIKNNHLVESDRLDNSETRAQHEEYLFGIPKELAGRDSAIYGMVFPKYDENDINSVKFYKIGPGSWYGHGENNLLTEAVVVFKKDSILDYTTFTNQDSLEHGRNPALGRFGGIQAPTNASNPVQTNSWYSVDGVDSIDDLANATLYNFSPIDDHDTTGYIEAQINGRYSHTIDNIDHVVFLEPPSEEIIEKLKELGIKYTISNAKISGYDVVIESKDTSNASNDNNSSMIDVSTKLKEKTSVNSDYDLRYNITSGELVIKDKHGQTIDVLPKMLDKGKAEISDFLLSNGVVKGLTPTQIALKNPMKKSSSLLSDNDIDNIIKTMKSIDLSTIDQDIIDRYVTSDGLDYMGLLDYALSNTEITSKDIEVFKELESVQRVINNPQETLPIINKVLSDIQTEVEEKGIDYLKQTDFGWLSFVIRYATRESAYRVNNKEILTDIIRKIDTLATKAIKINEFNKVYKGINIKTYGNNTEFLGNALAKVLTAIDELPSALLHQVENLNCIEVYDTGSPNNLTALFGFDKLIEDPTIEYFDTGAVYRYKSNTIQIFKPILIDDDMEYIYEILAHELGHSLDSFMITAVGTEFTDKTDLWEKAIESDNNTVSAYGDLNTQEDFAETCSLYARAINGYVDIDKIKEEYPARFRIMSALYDLNDAINDDANNISFDRKVEIMSIFDKVVEETSIIETLLGEDFIERYNKYSPIVKLSFARKMINNGVSKQFYNLFVNKDYFHNFDSEQLLQFYNLYNNSDLQRDILEIELSIASDFNLENIRKGLEELGDKTMIYRYGYELYSNIQRKDINSILSSLDICRTMVSKEDYNNTVKLILNNIKTGGI